MSWFPVTEPAAFEPRVADLAAGPAAQLGFLPNVYRAYAWRPERLLRWRAHYDDLMFGPSGLTRAEREMIAVVVSAENRCLYCLSSHGATLRGLLGDPVAAERLTLDYRRAGLDARTRAMLDYAVKLTREPEACGAADLAALRAHGFTEADCWDIVEITAMFNFTNRLADGIGMLPNPEYHGLNR